MAVQQAPYQLLERDGSFEIRFYEPLILAVSPETDLGGASGFGRLFNFISGQNRDRKKIAMTAPVLNDFDQPQMTIAFVMPHDYQTGTVPQPEDPSVRIRELPARRVAAVVFKGNATARVIAHQRAELLDWLERRHLETIGPIELARYNPPFIPGIFKRNELWVELKQLS
jgi:hypothetical protein